MAKTQKANTKMTQKEALAILHRLDDRVGRHLYGANAPASDVTLRSQLFEAFKTLDRAIHKTDIGLCQICYLREESDFDLEIELEPDKGRLRYVSCCLTCLEHLKAEKRPMIVKKYDYQQKDFVIVERYGQPQKGTTDGTPTEEACT